MDYSELLVEVRNRSGLPFVIESGTRITQAAERYLEKRVRTMEMETTATLATDEDGIAPLPADWLQAVGADEVKVAGREVYTDTANGTVEIRYYAKLPPVETNTTNWLLTAEPEIYVQALLMQAHVVAADAERVAAHRGVLEVLLADLSQADIVAKFANRRIEIEG